LKKMLRTRNRLYVVSCVLSVGCWMLFDTDLSIIALPVKESFSCEKELNGKLKRAGSGFQPRYRIEGTSLYSF